MSPRRLIGVLPARTSRLGLRGGFLLRWGVFYVVLAVPAIWTPAPPGSAQTYLQRAAPEWFPDVAVLWALAGIAGILFAFATRPRHDAFGFAAVVIVPYLWVAASLFAAVDQSSWRQAYGALVYAALALAPWFIAGYRNNKPVEAASGDSP